MPTPLKTLTTTTLSLVFCLSLSLVVSASTADSLQPASAGGVGQFDSLRVGSQGTGGVTYFNGTIINSTTGSGGSGVPVTFGDDVRIDGGITRGAAGLGDDKPVKIADNATFYGEIWAGPNKGNAIDGQSLVIADSMRPKMNVTNDNGSASYRWRSFYSQDGNFSGTVTTKDLTATGVITTGSLTATGSLTTGGFTSNGDSTVNADLTVVSDLIVSNNAFITGNTQVGGALNIGSLTGEVITSTNIVDGTIVGDDIANGEITPPKISGNGGANIPIAYGYVSAGGSLEGGTSNVTVTPDGSEYLITIDGVDYGPGQQVVVVTPAPTSNTDVFAYTAEAGEAIRVILWSSGAGGGATDNFHFVVFQI
ncbi:hypothetical protein KJ903_01225 [Patescibacteria group bacterium]|nr:hypothetical protein [Patescibacteria group bacterium]